MLKTDHCLYCNCRSIHGYGLCNTHYRRWIRRMPMESPIRPKYDIGVTCLYCSRTDIAARGLCQKHYQRWKKGVPIIRCSKTWTWHGYKWLHINGKDLLEHRYIIEQEIGRKLKTEEIIHHINENRLDNRLENLQIMSRSEYALVHKPWETTHDS